MKRPDLKTLLLFAAVLLFIILLIVTKCSTSKQADQNTASAVAQNEIINLKQDIAYLENKNTGYKAAQDSLLRINKSLVVLLSREQAKISVIALKYADIKSKFKELPDDSATGLFLDRADCSEVPVIKYENDYLIPIDPIRFYNDLSADFDQQKEVNTVQAKEIYIHELQIKTLTNIVNSKGTEVDNLNSIIENHKLIESEKDKQIKAEHRKYKQQKVKTYIVGAAGVVLFGVGLIL